MTTSDEYVFATKVLDDLEVVLRLMWNRRSECSRLMRAIQHRLRDAEHPVKVHTAGRLRGQIDEIVLHGYASDLHAAVFYAEAAHVLGLSNGREKPSEFPIFPGIQDAPSSG